MRAIGADESLLQYLTGNNSIISGVVHRIISDLSNRSSSCVEIYIELLYAKSDAQILIRFKDIQAFDFIYDSSCHPYYIERFKLFRTDVGFYCSLDPYDEMETMDDRDRDKIVAKSMEGFII